MLSINDHPDIRVSTHSRLKAAGCADGDIVAADFGFNTQPPEGGWIMTSLKVSALDVSTHSRLKAAGCLVVHFDHRERCFNTQPPEGGWHQLLQHQYKQGSFNTQPPEGGWI